MVYPLCEVFIHPRIFPILYSKWGFTLSDLIKYAIKEILCSLEFILKSKLISRMRFIWEVYIFITLKDYRRYIEAFFGESREDEIFFFRLENKISRIHPESSRFLDETFMDVWKSYAERYVDKVPMMARVILDGILGNFDDAKKKVQEFRMLMDEKEKTINERLAIAKEVAVMLDVEELRRAIIESVKWQQPLDEVKIEDIEAVDLSWDDRNDVMYLTIKFKNGRGLSFSVG